MKPLAHAALLVGARFYAPLILLLAFMLLATRNAGAGIGFVAGVVAAMALLIQALVFGGAAARRAFPPILARALLLIGLVAVLFGHSGAGPYQAQLAEAGLFAVTVSAASVVSAVLIGRAPTMRNEEL
jgi:hypothetical protein